MGRYIWDVILHQLSYLLEQPTSHSLKESCRGNRNWVKEAKETPGPQNVPQEDRYIYFDCRIHHTRDQTHVEAE